MKANAFPPLPTANDWAKLDRIELSLKAHRSALDNLSSRSDGMGIDQMTVRLNSHQSFVNDRNGPFGFLFRWFQTSR